MCVQYRGGAQYRGGFYDKCGGYLVYRGGVQYRREILWVPWGLSWVPWGISWCTWGISWVPWGCSVPWEDIILCNVSIVGGYHDTCGGFNEYHGGVQYRRGTQITKDFPPMVHMISSTCIMIFPMCIMISSMVLSIPHGTQDNPHSTRDILHGAEQDTQGIPTFIMIFPRSWTIPHGTQDIPQWYSWYPPRYQTPPAALSTPQYWTHIIQGDKVIRTLSKLTRWPSGGGQQANVHSKGLKAK